MLPPRLLARFGSLLLMAASGGFPLGCVTSPCERDDGRAVTYTGGRTDASRTYYETSPVEGPWVRFTSGTRLRLEHGLREAPRDWKAYLSFEEFPEQIAENAGSQVAVEPLPDDEYIEIVNDTCGDFFIRFTAETAPPTRPIVSDAEAPDAGGGSASRSNGSASSEADASSVRIRDGSAAPLQDADSASRPSEADAN